MKLTFTYAGKERVLAKHSKVQAQLAAGTIAPEVAAARPWYLRFTFDGREQVKRLQNVRAADAIREAKDLLNNIGAKPNDYAAFLAHQAAKRGLTIGQLAESWLALKCPKTALEPRSGVAAARMAETIRRALPYWSAVRVAAITPKTFYEFALWRGQNSRAGAVGRRTTILELAALSCLCQWAASDERIAVNPFAGYAKIVKSSGVVHCHEHMPDNDQQFHAILSAMFASADRRRVIAGGWLAFCALTGLRPGEPAALLNVPEASAYPSNLRHEPPGLVFPMPDGSRRMKISRLKAGQNPAVIIHPALADFLRHWKQWLGPAQQLFPLDNQPGTLNRHLAAACVAAGAPVMKPHGFGRAYYVRVRRSQGLDDAAIAVELGQSSNGKLIRSVYGDPVDTVGGSLHDWLPADAAPAWQQLTATAALPANVVAL